LERGKGSMFPCRDSAWAVITDVIHDGAERDMGNVMCICKAPKVNEELIFAVVAAVSGIFDIAITEVLLCFKDIYGKAVLCCHPDCICPLAMWEAR
jgi:hypothetical protein